MLFFHEHQWSHYIRCANGYQSFNEVCRHCYQIHIQPQYMCVVRLQMPIYQSIANSSLSFSLGCLYLFAKEDRFYGRIGQLRYLLLHRS